MPADDRGHGLPVAARLVDQATSLRARLSEGRGMEFFKRVKDLDGGRPKPPWGGTATRNRRPGEARRALPGKVTMTMRRGELLLHQIFFLRPTPQWADFRTPLRGYYFGAAGAHPGGGVMGAPGMLAAKEMLKDYCILH